MWHERGRRGGGTTGDARVHVISLAIALSLITLAMPAHAEAQEERAWLMRATVRGRLVKAPDLYLDPFFVRHASHWQGDTRNAAIGTEVTFQRRDSITEYGLALDWADLRMPAQFWLEEGEPVDKTRYTTVDLRLWSLTFTTRWNLELTEWFAPYLGGGLGLGFLVGEVLEYRPRAASQCSAEFAGRDPASDDFVPESCINEEGDPNPEQVDLDNPRAADRIPPVIPMLNIAAGVRFTIEDVGIVRLEVGLNDYLYVGLGVGAQW